MISVTDYDAIFLELQAKRKFLNESIQALQNQSDQKFNQALVKLTSEQLNKIRFEKNTLQQKYKEFIDKINEIVERNRISQKKLDHKEDNLYQIKTSLQPELLAFIPSVGLRHKRLLQQEQVDVKIQRHKVQNEERLRQQQNLRGIGDQELKQISQNLSKYAHNYEMSSPKLEDKDINYENGSLAISKSFNQSQPRQVSQQQPLIQTSADQNKFQQKPQRGQMQSQFQYGGGYDDDEYD